MEDLKVKGIKVVKERIEKFTKKMEVGPFSDYKFIRGEIAMLRKLGLITDEEEETLQKELKSAELSVQNKIIGNESIFILCIVVGCQMDHALKIEGG